MRALLIARMVSRICVIEVDGVAGYVRGRCDEPQCAVMNCDEL